MPTIKHHRMLSPLVNTNVDHRGRAQNNGAYDAVAFDPDPAKHVRLVWRMAGWVANQRGGQPEDHFGMCGEILIKACRCFKPQLGNRFSTYYCNAVKQETKRRDDQGQRLAVRRELVDEEVDGKTVRRSRVRWTTKSPRPVSDLMDDHNARMAFRGVDGRRPIDLLMEREERETAVRDLGRHMSEDLDTRQFDLVRQCAVGVSYERMGSHYGIGRERVRQVLNDAMHKDGLDTLLALRSPSQERVRKKLERIRARGKTHDHEA